MRCSFGGGYYSCSKEKIDYDKCVKIHGIFNVFDDKMHICIPVMGNSYLNELI